MSGSCLPLILRLEREWVMQGTNTESGSGLKCLYNQLSFKSKRGWDTKEGIIDLVSHCNLLHKVVKLLHKNRYVAIFVCVTLEFSKILSYRIRKTSELLSKLEH